MENLKIYVDRLKKGHQLRIEETLPPEFMEIDEEELSFADPVHLWGEAYLAEDHLVVHFSIETKARLPCRICNHQVAFPIVIKNSSLTVPLTDCRSSVYEIADEVRETILLEIPFFTECNAGKCPERQHIKQYFKIDEKPSSTAQETHFPFADLES